MTRKELLERVCATCEALLRTNADNLSIEMRREEMRDFLDLAKEMRDTVDIEEVKTLELPAHDESNS